MKKLEELHKEIKEVYEDSNCPNWDGYDADPLRDIDSYLKFADLLYQEDPKFLNYLEVAPVNDGSMDFEWMFNHYHNSYSIQVYKDKLTQFLNIDSKYVTKGHFYLTWDGMPTIFNNLRKLIKHMESKSDNLKKIGLTDSEIELSKKFVEFLRDPNSSYQNYDLDDKIRKYDFFIDKNGETPREVPHIHDPAFIKEEHDESNDYLIRKFSRILRVMGFKKY